MLPNLIRVCFIKIPFSFPSLIPCPVSPSDERENSERRAWQLPTLKKCWLLRILIATCLWPRRYFAVLHRALRVHFWTRSLSISPASHEGISRHLCPLPPTSHAGIFLILSLPFSLSSYTKSVKTLSKLCQFISFICTVRIFFVSLPSKVQRRGLEGGRCPPLGKPNAHPNTPVTAFKTY